MAHAFKILIIDDDPSILETVTDLLEAAGYQTLAGLGGAQGLSLARTEGPDLILVDYHMPVMDGPAVAERLRADETTRRIPVVALTSSTAEDANKLVAAGCIGFIPKPFDAETFPGLVGEFLRATVARKSRETARSEDVSSGRGGGDKKCFCAPLKITGRVSSKLA